MHRAWLPLFLVACSYHPPSSTADDDEGPTPDGSAEEAPPFNAACMSHDNPTLCLEFEDDFATQIAADGSINAFAAVANGLIAVSRDAPPTAGTKAAGFFLLDSRVTIDRDLVLDGDVSVEMWMQLGPVSLSERRVMFDSGDRFVVSYDNNVHAIRCGINGGASTELRVDSQITITDDNWHHVACTFNSGTKQMRVYIDGTVTGCKDLGASITQTVGKTRIGAPLASSVDRFVGALDAVHVYKSRLAPKQVCSSALAGESCNQECPAAGGEPGGGGEGGFGGGG